MLMRRLSYLLVAVLLVASAPSSWAAAKAGAKCTTKDLVVKSGKQSLICKKSGKTLKWSVQKSGGEQKPSNPGTGDSQLSALEEYAKKLVAQRIPGVPKLKTSLQSPDDKAVIQMTENAQYAFSVYESIAPLGYTPQWIVGEKESWVKDKLTANNCTNIAKFISPNQGSAGCELAVVWRAPDVRNDLIMQNTMLVQGGHELFHLYQTQRWGQYWDRVPDWVREGSANVGMNIILANFDGGKSFANYSIARKVEMSPRDKATCEASLQKWESNNTAEGFGNNKGCEYGLGLLMNEFLITKGFTLNDTLEMIGLIGLGTDFPTAFEKTYGMSTAKYFSELRVYLKTQNYGW